MFWQRLSTTNTGRAYRRLKDRLAQRRKRQRDRDRVTIAENAVAMLSDEIHALRSRLATAQDELSAWRSNSMMLPFRNLGEDSKMICGDPNAQFGSIRITSAYYGRISQVQEIVGAHFNVSTESSIHHLRESPRYKELEHLVAEMLELSTEICPIKSHIPPEIIAQVISNADVKMTIFVSECDEDLIELLALSDGSQKQMLMNLYDEFVSEFNETVAERLKLKEDLISDLSRAPNWSEVVPSRDTTQQTFLLYAKMDGMCGSLMKEHLRRQKFTRDFFGVLTAAQCSLIILYYYPQIPNALTLAEFLKTYNPVLRSKSYESSSMTLDELIGSISEQQENSWVELDRCI